MKAPQHITSSHIRNAEFANEKSHLVKSLKNDKIQKIPININLYKKIEKVADKRKIVLADIARAALELYIENPQLTYDSELSLNNTKKLIYVINPLLDMKINNFKNKYGISRSDLLRNSLSAWLIKEEEFE